jgi:hypothetical protein
MLESSFGHYKDELNENPMSGITDMALIIAALTANLDTLKGTPKNCFFGVQCQFYNF